MAKPQIADPIKREWFEQAAEHGRKFDSFVAIKIGSEQFRMWTAYFARLGWMPYTFATVDQHESWTAPCEWPGELSFEGKVHPAPMPSVVNLREELITSDEAMRIDEINRMREQGRLSFGPRAEARQRKPWFDRLTVAEAKETLERLAREATPPAEPAPALEEIEGVAF